MKRKITISDINKVYTLATQTETCRAQIARDTGLEVDSVSRILNMIEIELPRNPKIWTINRKGRPDVEQRRQEKTRPIDRAG